MAKPTKTDPYPSTAVDVNIYASSPKHAPQLVGNHENTDIGAFIAEYLDLDLEPITEELTRQNVDMGLPHPAGAEVVESEMMRWCKGMGPIALPPAAATNEDARSGLDLDTHHEDLKHR